MKIILLLIFFLEIIVPIHALSLPTKIKYLKFGMHQSGKKEDKIKGNVNNYYGFFMRIKSLLIFQNGFFFDIFGNKIHTLKDISCDSGLAIDGGYSKYVMDEFGNIYINNEPYQIKHSYFLRGTKTADSGWMRINNGILEQIVHDSGHYRPRLFQNLQMIT